MIETRRLKNVVVFIQTIYTFLFADAAFPENYAESNTLYSM